MVHHHCCTSWRLVQHWVGASRIDRAVLEAIVTCLDSPPEDQLRFERLLRELLHVHVDGQPQIVADYRFDTFDESQQLALSIHLVTHITRRAA